MDQITLFLICGSKVITSSKIKHCDTLWFTVQSFICESPHDFLQFWVCGRRFCRRPPNMHVPCSTRSSKCSKGNLFWKCTTSHFCSCVPPGPDNPPHPWLICRKGNRTALCSGLRFKNGCSSFAHTHCSPQRAELSPSRGAENHRHREAPHTVMTCMSTACWRWACFLSGAEINRGGLGRGGARVCMSVQDERLFRVGGFLPVNCVFPPLCLPVNWDCGVSTTGLVATERSQVQLLYYIQVYLLP